MHGCFGPKSGEIFTSQALFIKSPVAHINVVDRKCSVVGEVETFSWMFPSPIFRHSPSSGDEMHCLCCCPIQQSARLPHPPSSAPIVLPSFLFLFYIAVLDLFLQRIEGDWRGRLDPKAFSFFRSLLLGRLFERKSETRSGYFESRKILKLAQRAERRECERALVFLFCQNSQSKVF